MAILQNGPYIVLGGREGGVRIFDIRSERVLKDLQSPHTMAVKAIAVHGTGTGFATGSLDGSVNVVSSSRFEVVAMWEELHPKTSYISLGGKSLGVTALAVGKGSGTVFSCGGDGTIKCGWPAGGGEGDE